MEETLDLSLSHTGHNSVRELNNCDDSNNLASFASNGLKEGNDVSTTNGLENENENEEDNQDDYSANADVNNFDVDGEDNLSDSIKLKELSLEELKLKEEKIRRLKAALRNEENKLIILKKIKQSQLMKENISSIAAHHPSSASHISPHHHHLINASIKSQINPNRIHRPSPSTSYPSNAAHHSSHHHIKAAHLGSRPQSVLNPPLPNRNLSNYGQPPPPIGMTSHRSSHGSSHPLSHNSHHHQSLLRSGYNSRTPVTTPPNMVLGYPVQDLRASHTSNQVNNYIHFIFAIIYIIIIFDKFGLFSVL